MTSAGLRAAPPTAALSASPMPAVSGRSHSTRARRSLLRSDDFKRGSWCHGLHDGQNVDARRPPPTGRKTVIPTPRERYLKSGDAGASSTM
jgi:hypothetical protein